MPDVRFLLDGATQFAADMRRLTGRIEDADVRELAAVGRGLIPRVQSVMPKVTGRLAASVAVNPQTQFEAADVTASTVYAGWIEFGGTRGRPYVAQGRFLMPVVRASGSTVGIELQNTTNRTIGGFSWSHTSM
jgi:hypothetical protein